MAHQFKASFLKEKNYKSTVWSAILILCIYKKSMKAYETSYQPPKLFLCVLRKNSQMSQLSHLLVKLEKFLNLSKQMLEQMESFFLGWEK